jgi:FixJ family two-component response regulator
MCSTSEPMIYLIDDNQDVREAIRGVLQSVSLKVEAFRSAEDFMIRRRGDEVACLISDIRLPGISGLELQAALARQRDKLPIIFVSGHGDIRMSVQAIKGGAIDFLPKPFREQDLLDSAQNALNRARADRDDSLRLQSLRESFDTLSSREKQIMHLVCSGLMNKQTAAIVGISEITVKVHRHNVMKKLGAKTLPDLVRITDLLGQIHPNALSLQPVARSKPTTDSITRSQVNGREYSVTDNMISFHPI